jgi:hypothetical protein
VILCDGHILEEIVCLIEIFEKISFVGADLGAGDVTVTRLYRSPVSTSQGAQWNSCQKNNKKRVHCKGCDERRVCK